MHWSKKKKYKIWLKNAALITWFLPMVPNNLNQHPTNSPWVNSRGPHLHEGGGWFSSQCVCTLTWSCSSPSVSVCAPWVQPGLRRGADEEPRSCGEPTAGGPAGGRPAARDSPLESPRLQGWTHPGETRAQTVTWHFRRYIGSQVFLTFLLYGIRCLKTAKMSE